MGTLQEVAQSFRVTRDMQDAQRRQQMEMLQELRTIEQNTREGNLQFYSFCIHTDVK